MFYFWESALNLIWESALDQCRLQLGPHLPRTPGTTTGHSAPTAVHRHGRLGMDLVLHRHIRDLVFCRFVLNRHSSDTGQEDGACWTATFWGGLEERENKDEKKDIKGKFIFSVHMNTMELAWPGLAWPGLGWPGAGLAWSGLVWSGLVWSGR